LKMFEKIIEVFRVSNIRIGLPFNWSLNKDR